MADTTNPDAAEKAYAAAAEKVVAKPVEAAPVAQKAVAPVKADKPARAAPKASATKTIAKKAPAKKAAAKAKAVRAAKPARQAPVRKTTVKLPKLVSKKDTKMATTQTKTTDFTAKIQGAVKDAQDRARTAFEKSQAAFGDAGEFNKGNLEALVESTKILAQGLQAMGKTYVEEVRSAFSTVQADVKELTSVKTPSEFVQLQTAQLRKHFDNAVAYNSKSAEAALKLANDAFQPISNRVTLAVEKVRKAA